MEVYSGKASQDYDILKIFGCPACYHTKKDKLDLEPRRMCFFISREM